MESFFSKDVQESNITRIAKYILEQGETSKNEIASALNLSMPTTLQYVKDLMRRGIIHEVGEYQSTGGRKAKTLSIVESLYYSVGIEITANHVSFVLIDLKVNIVFSWRIRLVFEHAENYYTVLAEKLLQFIKNSGISAKQILGVGFSIPGIVISSEQRLMVSHVLHLKNIDLSFLSKYIPFPICFENDAVCAAMAERKYLHHNTLYLSLSNSVGGAIYLNNEIYYGAHYRSGEFGHMIIESGGRQCYCGKCGCVDAYCSARILTDYTDGVLEDFFQKLEIGDVGAHSLWNNYLQHLAITISNLHLAFDCDIILGGYVGSYMDPYIPDLWDYLQEYRLFEDDSQFLIPCHFKQNATGVGIAMSFIYQFLLQLQ